MTRHTLVLTVSLIFLAMASLYAVPLLDDTDADDHSLAIGDEPSEPQKYNYVYIGFLLTMGIIIVFGFFYLKRWKRKTR